MFWSLDRTRLTFCFAALAEMTSAKCPKIRQLTTKAFVNILGSGQLGPKHPDVRGKKKVDINLIDRFMSKALMGMTQHTPDYLR